MPIPPTIIEGQQQGLPRMLALESHVANPLDIVEEQNRGLPRVTLG